MELHVVFGSGQVGAPLVQELVARGHRVRVVRRTQGAASAGVELAVGNAFDRTVCVQNAQSATAVYHCLNVAYSTKAWADELPKFQENLIEAAGRTGARLVVLENLYMLGRPNGPLNEAHARATCQSEGRTAAEVVGGAFRGASGWHRKGGRRTRVGPFWTGRLAVADRGEPVREGAGWKIGPSLWQPGRAPLIQLRARRRARSGGARGSCAR